ncbi:MAG: PadR family transcriptional regulator, partial [Solirubrobacteraceae bacterium]
MSTRPPSETSYAVLALVGMLEPATPYQLKQVAQVSLLNFWSIPHTQLYTECTRLTDLGLLDEQREQTGRRRRVYRVTPAGREALEQWREEPQTELQELRDAGLLKLFCGADPAPLAIEQLARHQERLKSYEEMADQDGMSRGLRLALEAGIGHEREYVRFWSSVLPPTPHGAMPST